MFKEFFFGSFKTSFGAWVGIVAIVGYAAFLAHVKAQLNDWYASFYDLLQEGGGIASSASGDASGDVDLGSGEGAPSLATFRARVTDELLAFLGVVAPLVWASPAAKWVRSTWALHWRLALMHSYLGKWSTRHEPIEGASQRLHEDTQRFSNGLETCLITLLDAAFTLIIFSPILCKLSVQVSPPVDLGGLSNSWLWIVAWLASLVGLGGAALVGQKLVGLEVENQKVEALLRKDLVLLETTPAVIVGTASGDPITPMSPPEPLTLPPERARAPGFGPTAYFNATLVRLRRNYMNLFRHFSLLNLFLSAFDQIMVLFPYLIAGPLVFADDPARRITLGTLMKLSNSFEKTFSAMNVVTDSWGSINEFRSTLRRLREFEGKLNEQSEGVPGCLLPGRRHRNGARTRDSSINGGDEDGGDDGGGGGGGGRTNRPRFRETHLVVEGAPVTNVHPELQLTARLPAVSMPPLAEDEQDPSGVAPDDNGDRGGRSEDVYDMRV
jgi:peptide/bleomycin uptake transporter